MQELKLCVVLDEAGVGGFSDLITTDNDINMIAQALAQICEHYTLVLVGTGLADVARDISSERPFAKFRMLEWTMDQFKTMVGVESAEPKVVDIVTHNPRLKKMVSNARCAYFVWLAIKRYQSFTPQEASNRVVLNPTALTNIVVEVSHQYMDNNGLKDVKQVTENAQLLVRAVLLALQDDLHDYQNSKLLQRPRTLKFPDYKQYLPAGIDDQLSTLLVKLCNGVVDVHIETNNGRVCFMDSSKERYAISISSGMALVLSVLLGSVNAITLDWLSFETTVAIGEMQEVLKQCEPEKILRSPLRLVHSQQQLPGQVKGKLRVPQDLTDTIFVNGPRAEFGDVFSLTRVCQAKFAEGGKQAKLHLLEELHKLGVTSNRYYKKQQRFTTLLLGYEPRTGTSHNDDDDDDGDGDDDRYRDNDDKFEDARRENYVASLLMAEQENKEAIAFCEISLSSDTDDSLDDADQEIETIVSAEEDEIKGSTVGQEDKTIGSAKIDESKGLTVVFATNALSFRIPSLATEPKKMENWKMRAKVLDLKNAKGKEAQKKAQQYLLKNKAKLEGVTIHRQDVKVDGRLIKNDHLPGYVEPFLRNDIEVDFQFMFY